MRAVNLIPADQRGGSGVGAGRSGAAPTRCSACSAGWRVFALLYGIAAIRSPAASEVASLTAQAQQAQARPASSPPTRASSRCANSASRRSLQLVDSRFDWAHAFHEFGRVLPARSVSLASLNGTVGTARRSSAIRELRAPRARPRRAAPRSASATPPGSVPTFTLTGCADQPGGGRADARPPAPDRRRQRSHAAELHQVRPSGGSGGAAAAVARRQRAGRLHALRSSSQPLPSSARRRRSRQLSRPRPTGSARRSPSAQERSDDRPRPHRRRS